MLASQTRPHCCQCVPCGLIGAWAIFASVDEGRYFNASGMPDSTEVNATLEFTGYSRNIPAKSDMIRITGGYTLDGQSISYLCVYVHTHMHDCICFCMTMCAHLFLCVSQQLMHACTHACHLLMHVCARVCAHARVCAPACACAHWGSHMHTYTAGISMCL